MASTHTSICRFCHASCPILVDVEDGRPVRIVGDRDNPIYHGYTCPKGRALPEQHANPERLLHSQHRLADGTHEAIASEQAMDEVAERLQAIIDKHGPRSVAMYTGTFSFPYPAATPLAHALFDSIGSRMRSVERTMSPARLRPPPARPVLPPWVTTGMALSAQCFRTSAASAALAGRT